MFFIVPNGGYIFVFSMAYFHSHLLQEADAGICTMTMRLGELVDLWGFSARRWEGNDWFHVQARKCRKLHVPRLYASTFGVSPKHVVIYTC